MTLDDAISLRRSIRNYTEEAIDHTTIRTLLHYATLAPSAMNSQPWAFAVIQDRELLKQYSDRAKTHLLGMIENEPALEKYRSSLSNPDFNIFYNAETLILIFAKPQGPHAYGDCCLAAQNLMLKACELGLGSCWIGFSSVLFNLPELKQELGIPIDYAVVAPLIVGFPQKQTPPIPRKEAEVVFWK